ncbi:unnamed protein product [Absidia cylindrospora]
MSEQHWTSDWENGLYNFRDIRGIAIMEKHNMNAPSYYRHVFQQIVTVLDVSNVRQQPQHTYLADKYNLQKKYDQLLDAYENDYQRLQDMNLQVELTKRLTENTHQYITQLQQSLSCQQMEANITTQLTLLRQQEQFESRRTNELVDLLIAEYDNWMDRKRTLDSNVRSLEEESAKKDALLRRVTTGLDHLHNQILNAHNDMDVHQQNLNIVSQLKTLIACMRNPQPEFENVTQQFIDNSSITNNNDNNAPYEPTVMGSTSTYPLSDHAAISYKPLVIGSPNTSPLPDNAVIPYEQSIKVSNDSSCSSYSYRPYDPSYL